MEFKFEYFCNKCGEKKIKDVGFICRCGGEFKLNGRFEGYGDPFTPYVDHVIDSSPNGRYIDSRETRRKILKETGQDILPSSNYREKKNGRMYFFQGGLNARG